jgi:lysophospholipase L1-like esterase
LASESSDHEIVVINEGVVGDTSTLGLKRVPNVLEHKPDVVLAGFGMNDWRKGVTCEQFNANLMQIVDRRPVCPIEGGLPLVLLSSSLRSSTL